MMRLSLRLTLLVSLVPLAALLAPATPGLATGESIITVNTTADELNIPVGDGDCSLREAIRAANTNNVVDVCPAGGSGTDTIFIPEGVYVLSQGIENDDEDNGLTGDLDIRGNLVIQGDGKDNTIIDGGYNPDTYNDRVFHVAVAVTVQISRLTIRNGWAPNTPVPKIGGGGILNQLGALTLREVSILNNNSAGVGGGITNSSSLTVFDSFISGNHGVVGGGIYNTGMLSISGSTLYNNSARESGGGIDNSSNVTLENVTISGNVAGSGSEAGSGGGIFSDGVVNVRHSSILNNLTNLPGNGANIHNKSDEFYFYNTLVASSQNVRNCFGSGLNSLGFNLEGHPSGVDFTCNFTNEYADPLVGALADNGGPTPTHALLEGSPAIDGGDDTFCPPKDQRGAIRPADGDGVGGAVCDIGAFEYEGIFREYVFVPIIIRQPGVGELIETDLIYWTGQE